MTTPEIQAEANAELIYRDPKAAYEWLVRAFGFELTLLITESGGKVVIARVECGNCVIMVSAENDAARDRSPLSLSGANTQSVHIRFNQDIDAHFERSKAAGAKVVRAPRQEFYGDRTYVVADPEGHRWTFAQTIPGAGGPPPEGWNVKIIRAR